MRWREVLKDKRVALLCVVGLMCLWTPSPARAAIWRTSKASHRFQLFVPPNNEVSGRYSALVITALWGEASAPTTVSLIDDDADGDDDDSQLNVQLSSGQSLVRYIKDGAINDDYSGKWDGDYFIIEADAPVIAYLATDSDWQHDWAPADDGQMRGHRFFLFANKTSVTARDLNVFSYEDDTSIALYDITQTPLQGSGVTTLAPAQSAPTVLSVTLDEGEDLNVIKGQGYDLLEAGRTYELRSTKPVTVLYGALGSKVNDSGARDGGGFIPGQSGDTLSDKFYFTIPHRPGAGYEQELRLVSFAQGVEVSLEGWSVAAQRYEELRREELNSLEHLDYIGTNNYALYRLTTTGGEVAAFEANWLETGASGTSDVMSFISGDYKADGSQDYLVYMGPPGNQGNTSISDEARSHVYIYGGSQPTQVQVLDADTQGQIINQTLNIAANQYADFYLNRAQYDALNIPSQGKRPYLKLSSDRPVAVCMSNWNDNWMAYATSALTRNPDLSISLPEQTALNSVQRATLKLSNFGDLALSSNVIQVTLPQGAQLIDAQLGGIGPITQQLTSSGQLLLRFEQGVLAGNQQRDGWIDFSLTSGQDGQVLTIQGLASAQDLEGPLSAVASAATAVRDESISEVLALRSQGSDRQITVSWELETTGVSAATTQTLWRAPSPSGPYVALVSYAPAAGDQGSLSYIYVDQAVSNQQTYYYRVTTSTAAGSQGLAGPITGLAKDTVPPPKVTLIGQLEAQDAILSWSVSIAPDLTSYQVQRKLNAGSWVTVATLGADQQRWVDTGLLVGQEALYRVLAVDDDGLTSAPSNTVSLKPSLAQQLDQLYCFEDMIGPGANDWDFNDLIVRVRSQITLNGEQIERIELEFEPLARGAGYVHQLKLKLPLVGPWSAVKEDFDGSSGARLSEATYSGDGELEITLSPDTRALLPAVVGSFTNTSPRQDGFRAGRRVRLSVTMSAPLQLSQAALGTSPLDLYLRLPYLPPPQEVHHTAHGGFTEPVQGPAALNAHSLGFVYVMGFDDAPTSARWPAWPYEGVPAWIAYEGFSDWLLSGQPAGILWHLELLEGQYFSMFN